MDADIFYSILRAKRLPDNVTDNTINDYINDHRVSEDERLRRAQFMSMANEGRVLNTVVSRIAFFSSTVLQEISAATTSHNLEDVYHQMRVHMLIGDLALLANFTFGSFVDQKVSKNFTITPEKRLVISTVSRALQMQSSISISPNKARKIVEEI